MYKSGTDLLVKQSHSLFVVTSGLLKVTYTDTSDNLQEYFLASGKQTYRTVHDNLAHGSLALTSVLIKGSIWHAAKTAAVYPSQSRLRLCDALLPYSWLPYR